MKLGKAVTDRLAALSAGGCCVAAGTGSVPMAVGWIWWDKTGTVYWCQLMPEDQHHVHAIDTTAAEVIHDRDVSLTSADGLGYYFAPVDEWDIDRNAWVTEWAVWQSAIHQEGELGLAVRASLADFLEDSIGSRPDI